MTAGMESLVARLLWTVSQWILVELGVRVEFGTAHHEDVRGVQAEPFRPSPDQTELANAGRHDSKASETADPFADSQAVDPISSR